MTDEHKSWWVTHRDLGEAFLSSAFNGLWHGVTEAASKATPEVETALINVVKGAALGAMAAQATAPANSDEAHTLLQGALKGGTEAAKAQEAPLIAAGITITTDQLGILAGHMAAVAQAGPPPAQDGTAGAANDAPG